MATKRMPKGDITGTYRVTWWEKTRSGNDVQGSQFYRTRAEAEAAIEIAKTHKTKSSVRLLVWQDCQDDKSVVAHKESQGGSWDGWKGQWLFSARY